MPVLGSRWRGLSGRISSVLRVWVVVVLLRWCERAELLPPSWISDNKACGHLLFCCRAFLLLLRPAGRGGEGKEKNGAVLSSLGGWLGVLPLPAHWRGTGQAQLLLSARLPWWKRPGEFPVAGTPNKRSRRPCLPPGDAVRVYILSAGRGGGGEGVGPAAAMWARQDDLLHTRAHQALAVAAIASLADKAANCACEVLCQPPMWRLSLEQRAGDLPLPAAKWFVPGGGGAAGGAGSSSVEHRGPDCLIFIFSRVLSVVSRDCFVILIFLRSCMNFVTTDRII